MGLREVVKKTFNLSPENLEPKYRMVGGLVVAEPLDYWRQGSPEDKLNEVHPLAAIPVFVDEKVIRVPIIGGNSVFGIMKNSIAEYMFDYYRSNKPELLKKIYYDKPESAFMVSLFRMRTPFTGIKRPDTELVNAVWANFIWTVWGIGLAPWAPQKAFTASSLIPLLSTSSARAEVVKHFAEKLGVDPANVLKPVNYATIEENIELGKYGLTAQVIKLRHPMAQDYYNLSIRPSSDEEIEKWMKEVGLIKNEKQKEKPFSLLTPIPVRILVAPADMPLVSLISQKLAMKLFSDAEIATIAFALRKLCVIGLKENTFKITAGVIFKNEFTGETIVLKKVGYTCGLNAEESEKLVEYSDMFTKWVADTDYPEYIREVAFAIVEAAKREKKSR